MDAVIREVALSQRTPAALVTVDCWTSRSRPSRATSAASKQGSASVSTQSRARVRSIFSSSLQVLNRVQ